MPILFCCCAVTDTFTVTGCNGLPLANAGVEVQPSGGGSPLASGTTDAAGQVPFTLPAGAYDVVVSKTRFNTHTFSATFNGGTHTLAMLAYIDSTTYACFNLCADPIKKTLTYSDPYVPITRTLTYRPGSSDWYDLTAGPSGATHSWPACPAYGCLALVAYWYTKSLGVNGVLTTGFPAAPGSCPGSGIGTTDAGFLLTSLTCPDSGFSVQYASNSPKIYCNTTDTVTITE